MTARPKKLFESNVTLEQMLAFDPSRPETHTRVPVIDAVLDALIAQHIMNMWEISDYLGVPQAKLSVAFEVEAGMQFKAFRNELERQWVLSLQEEHPDWGPDAIAKELGFADRTTVWNILHREVSKRYYSAWKKQCEERMKNQ